MEELIVSVTLGMMVGAIVYRRVGSSGHVVRLLRVKRMIPRCRERGKCV